MIACHRTEVVRHGAAQPHSKRTDNKFQKMKSYCENYKYLVISAIFRSIVAIRPQKNITFLS